MTIKQQGGIFGRNPTFNNVEIDGNISVDNLKLEGNTISSTNSNGDIALSPNGAGFVTAPKMTFESTNPTIVFQTEGGTSTDQVYIQKYSNDLYIYNKEATGKIFFGTNNATKMTLTDSGNLAFNSGLGIDFSATSDAAGSQSELLSDYEHGTWTVTDQSAAGLTFTNPTGQYVRVGRFVSAFAAFTFPSTADTNNASIGGLPYSSLDGNESRATGVITYSNYAATHSLWIYGPRNSGQFLIIDSAANAKTNANLSGKTFYVQFNYQT